MALYKTAIWDGCTVHVSHLAAKLHKPKKGRKKKEGEREREKDARISLPGFSMGTLEEGLSPKPTFVM